MFNETCALLEKMTARYKCTVQVYFPGAADVKEYIPNKGIHGFYESVYNRKACCYTRKVKPFNQALKGAGIRIIGLCAEQSDNRKCR